jgi:uroporphyrinogen III methyltransferase/synthase
VAVTERGTSTDQRTVTTTLSSAGATMADGRFPVLAVVGSTVTMRETLSWFESKPLFGWEVLVPRTKEQSASTLARLQRHGAQAKVVPTISVEPPAHAPAARARRQGHGHRALRVGGLHVRQRRAGDP